MAAVLPTKGNLMAAKRSRALAQTGYELMDRKRNILVREMMSLLDDASAIQKQIDEVFHTAYAALARPTSSWACATASPKGWSRTTAWTSAGAR